MIWTADLHTHTTASDGQYPPGELVRMAGERGLEVLAVTDHDSLDGLAEATRAGAAEGIRVLRGVELSAREYPNLHILGYRIRPELPALAELCKRLQKRREQRNAWIADYLMKKGVSIPLGEVEALAAGGVIGRPHFAQAIVQHGFAADNREAFGRYLDTDEFQKASSQFKAGADECIEAIKASGGKASLAHPYQLGLDAGKLEALVQKLAGCGLDAVECCYPRHTAEQELLYRELARKYSLHVTGGSDFHGERVKPDIHLAALPLELDWLLGE